MSLVPHAASPADSDPATATAEAFRASLFYIAADLQRLAADAPVHSRQQVMALSALLAAIAR